LGNFKHAPLIFRDLGPFSVLVSRLAFLSNIFLEDHKKHHHNNTQHSGKNPQLYFSFTYREKYNWDSKCTCHFNL